MLPFSPKLGALEHLPIEVLNLVVTNVQHTDFKSICTLRLVCKALDALAGPLAFSSLSFVKNYNDDNHGKRLIAQFQDLAAGSGPYSRWAQTLVIDHDGLYPYLRRSGSYEKDSKKALEDRAKTIVPAMESLTNLKRASFRINPSDPYEDVLGALSKLPKLNELSLTLGWSLDGPPAALDRFSDLRALDLTNWRLFPSNLDAIERLLERCSASVEILKLLPGTWPNNRWQWSDEHPETRELRNVPIRRITADTTFPQLKKLVIGCDGIYLADFYASTCASLTQLDIRSCTKESVPSHFWISLRDAGICLEALCVFPLSQAACDYLVSYVGLRTLRLCYAPQEFAAPPTTEGTEVMADRVFNSIIPNHQSTLQHLAFQGIKFEAFAIDNEKIRRVLGCKKLQSLWTVYNHPGGRPYDTAHPDIVRVISQLISNVPNLQELTMQSVLRSYNQRLPPGSISVPISPPRTPSGRIMATGVGPLKVAMRRGFWECVREAEEELEIPLAGGPRDVNGTAQREFVSRRSVHVEWRA